jgi:hypothetical protein
MKASRFFVSAVATATVVGIAVLGCAQSSSSPRSSTGSNYIGDTGKSTFPASENETPGPSTDTMTAPSGSAPNTMDPRMKRN